MFHYCPLKAPVPGCHSTEDVTFVVAAFATQAVEVVAAS